MRGYLRERVGSLVRFVRPVGRTYGYRALPRPAGPPEPPDAVDPRLLTPAGGWAASRADSRALMGGSSGSPGRAFVNRTADDLQTGPAPARIERGTTARNGGVVGRGVAGWPYDGNALFVPHQVIPRRPITVTPFARTIDSGVTVPAIPIGGPLS